MHIDSHFRWRDSGGARVSSFWRTPARRSIAARPCAWLAVPASLELPKSPNPSAEEGEEEQEDEDVRARAILTRRPTLMPMSRGQRRGPQLMLPLLLSCPSFAAPALPRQWSEERVVHGQADRLSYKAAPRRASAQQQKLLSGPL
ncbi:unnamed protein product [Prorocentrum cordatum]|uniref:Uncharacterized protein n=1 Tax=Prorocentrum cordatum TaxID=2364126 RepID=A0ABN9S5D7_9DINO|nr:unnamed protein product [Polarella glacialis]